MTWMAVLLTCLMPDLVYADKLSIESFVGSWKGAEARSEPHGLAADALSVEIRAEAEGFSLSWRDLGKKGGDGIGSEAIEALFVPADRPGVYEYQPSSRSLLTRMFASPATGNPLEGETLIWARIDGQTLAVYSMKIDRKGGFDLDHYSWTKTDRGLLLTFVKKTEEVGADAPIEGELVSGEG
jgi:hypothetical protein